MSGSRQKLRMGPSGSCVCPKCGKKVAHRRGTPCIETTCPSCGSKMVREGGAHDKAIKKGRG